MENLGQFGSVLLRRLVFVVPILFGVVTLTFLVTRVVPGDPSYQLAGPFAGTDAVKQIQHQLGTDRPLWDQYVSYVTNAAHLDFGKSFFTGQPVQTDLVDRLPSTLMLIVLAMTVATVIGLTAGIYSARREERRGDRAVRYGSFFLLSIPDYWLGLLLLYVFFFRLHWAPPPTGQLGPTDAVPTHITGAALIDSTLTANGGAFVSALHHALLPVITLGLILSAPLARLMRSSMLEVQQADYIRFGRACGLSSRRLLRYSVRAALPPVVTFGGILFTVLIGGAVLVETVFSWGGAGQYAADAIKQQDFPAIQGFVLVTGAISVIVFLIVDLLYVYIDPRVKL